MRALAAIALAIATAPALAQTFPARTGESGLVDVPDAEVVGLGRGLLGADLRLDGGTGGPVHVGPFPIYAVAGLGESTEAGLAVRESGQPGDPRPARVLFGGALKLQLRKASDWAPSVAVDATVDRLNGDPVYGGRLIASTERAGSLRAAAFVGGEYGDLSGVTYGAALAVRHRSGVEGVLEGLGGPRGKVLGLAFRRQVLPTTALSLGVSWLPDDGGFRVSLGFGFGASPKKAPIAAPVSPPGAAVAPEEEPAAEAALGGDRPRFRLRVPVTDPSGLAARTTQHAPWAPPHLLAPGGVPQRSGPRVAAPSAEDVLASQLAEQEGLVEARARRLVATEKQLQTRLSIAGTDGGRLDDRERALSEREGQLDGRERRVVARGAPTREQRQLEGQEAQLSAQERQLAAEERSLGPAIDAAEGRAGDAATREDQERQEINRLTASLSGQSRAQTLEVRRQLVTARGRQLAATEARLVALGDRIDAIERQLRARDERLDAWQRRLDTRSERLAVVEKRSALAEKGPEQLGPRPGQLGPAQRAEKDRAVFVMVVKSPTAILKEPAGARPAVPALPSSEAIRPGAAVEKAVAAATVITFASPAAKLGELDRETLDGIARLAAREGAEVLVWARAKDPGLMAEAQRRAQEIRARIAQVGPLPDRRIVTRVTVRPGAQSVDVVVSALRDGPPAPVAQPAPGQPAPGAPAAAGVADRMLTGETARRRLREAVVAAQPTIEACVGDHLAQTKLVRAEGVLKITVDATGKVIGVGASEGDLAGGDLEACLRAAAPEWKFPPADGEYVVDVPITVILGGPAK